MDASKKTKKEIQSEISRLQSTLAKRGQNKPSGKARKKKGKGNPSSVGPSVTAPLNSARMVTKQTPRITPTKEGCVVSNRELIATLITPSPAGWAVLKRYRINPGSGNTFPWLSTMANSWESYRFRKLKFHYIHRCSATVPGSLLMSPDYDAQDGQPATEQLAAMQKGSVECSPWQDITLDLLPQSMNRTYKAHYCMSDSRFATTQQDEKTLDSAQVFISSDSDAGSATWGKLWVDYEVEFFTPQPPVVVTGTGGATLSLQNGLPTVTGGLFQNAAADITINQDVQNPIFQAINNPNAGTGQLLKVLRDWSGHVNASYESTTGLFNASKGMKMYKTDPLTNIQTLLPFSSSDSHFSLAANNFLTNDAGVRTIALNQQDADLKAGDIIGIASTGMEAVSAALTNPFLRMAFGGSNSF